MHSFEIQTYVVALSLSLRFNGHFPGEPGLDGFTEAKDYGSGGDNWNYISRAKLQSNHHHQQTNAQLFTGRMPFLSPNQRHQSTEGEGPTSAHETNIL